MPTDLSCTTCQGTGIDPSCGHPRHEHDNCPLCSDCGGSGIAAWAVEAAASVLVELTDDDAKVFATRMLAAVREEAKNQ